MMTLVRSMIFALAAILPVSQVHAQAPAKDRLVDSVDRGLAFLALLQEKDGSWQAGGARHPAVTSLALMAFLSAGHVPGEGPYQAQVEKGIRWVLTQQQPNGIFQVPGWEEMYQNGICTLMLAEAAAMVDAKTAAELKPKLARAVKAVLQGQRTQASVYRGGWRYQLEGTDADISVTGWQILALRAARNLGCDVPAERIDLAMQFVQQCRDSRSGGFSYQPGAQVTQACTGTCILALELQGKDRHHSREALQAGSYLIKNPLKQDDPHFHYAAYYTAQAMFQLGNNYWNIHRPHLHKLLLDSQQRNGGWLTNDNLGVSYSTALALLALTVEYRLLPIYQRDEENASARGE
jgi:prenyltransferase beta subunit